MNVKKRINSNGKKFEKIRNPVLPVEFVSLRSLGVIKCGVLIVILLSLGIEELLKPDLFITLIYYDWLFNGGNENNRPRRNDPENFECNENVLPSIYRIRDFNNNDIVNY